MSSFLGNTTNKDVYLGSTKIQKIYLGSTQMYSSLSVNLASNAIFSDSFNRIDTSAKVFTFKTDGTITASLYGNTSAWTDPVPSEGTGNQYWMKVIGTKLDNNPTFNLFGSYDTWLAMSSDRSFGMAKANSSSVGECSAKFDIQIASDASGINIVDSGQFVMTINYYQPITESVPSTGFIP